MATNYDRDVHIAEAYDQLETQADDVALLRRLIGNAGPLRVREPFCGTGRILIPLVLDGHTVVGTDLSEPMLARCRAKVAALPQAVQERVELRQEDAVSSRWGEGFDLVLLGANCLYELGSEEDQRACIRHAAECVRPGGWAFIDNEAIDTVHPEDLSPRREPPSFECANGTRLAWHGETVGVDVDRKLWFRHRTVEATAPDGSVHHEEWDSITRPVGMLEVRDWLMEAGFEIVELFGSRAGVSFQANSDRAIFWAQKTQRPGNVVMRTTAGHGTPCPYSSAGPPGEL
jgi:SAM-dependent methyltransferase